MYLQFSCSVVSNTLRPLDGSLPGSSVYGISQARIWEWVAISSSRGIFLTQELNLALLHSRQILYCLGHQGSIYSRGFNFDNSGSELS